MSRSHTGEDGEGKGAAGAGKLSWKAKECAGDGWLR